MLVHLVCFKYRQDVDAAARAAHRQKLAALADIEGVVDLKVGEDVIHSQRSYDSGLMVLLPDLAALETYRVHPKHVPVAQLGSGLCDSIVSVDFLA